MPGEDGGKDDTETEGLKDITGEKLEAEFNRLQLRTKTKPMNGQSGQITQESTKMTLIMHDHV